MTRIGQNPLKFSPSAPYRPYISAGIVTHCTDEPYHADRLQIVARCIESIKRDKPGELLIWDNGSTLQFRAMLKEMQPDVLIESYNIGLDAARHNLIELARGMIFCYSDDDIYHEAGWLQKQIEILMTYPNVGTVSGSPQRVHFKYGNNSNTALAKKYKMTIETGRLLPDDWERNYCRSVGCGCNDHAKAHPNITDTLLTYKGVKAWAHGHHMQFTAYRDIVKNFFPANDVYMGKARPMDEAVDNAGYMRLTTFDRTTWHMGNKL